MAWNGHTSMHLPQRTHRSSWMWAWPLMKFTASRGQLAMQGRAKQPRQESLTRYWLGGHPEHPVLIVVNDGAGGGLRHHFLTYSVNGSSHRQTVRCRCQETP
jgi:hypothetical protein